jgi:hypothetical protein
VAARLTAMQTSFVSITTASLLALPAAIATAPQRLPGLRAAAAGCASARSGPRWPS